MGRGFARSAAFGENTALTIITPHEQFLPFPRGSVLGRSLPTWLITPNTVLKRFGRNKSEPLCDEVELLDANPKTPLVRRESTVSDLAPLSENEPCLRNN